jgi:hypothetical protein
MAVHEVAFELECFEWADERLEVAGRWKGLGGRRLARAVLTVDVEAGRRKRLVALPGGHFGAAAESWRAAFAWPGDPGEITGAELEVGGNVVVDLPLPDRRRRRRKRPAVDPGDEVLRAEVDALRGQIERLRGELAGRERENMQLRAELDEAEGDEAGASGSTVEIERVASAREDDLTAELERLVQERDRTRADLSAEIERLHGDRARWQAELDELRQAFSDAAVEAEATRDHHRAQLAALERELVAERASVERLNAELIARPELPLPATASGRHAAAGPPTEAMPAPTAPAAPADDATQPMPAPADDATEAMPAPAAPADDATQAMPAPAGDAAVEEASAPAAPLQAIVDAAAVPGALDPPGPLRAGARPAAQSGVEGSPSRIPAWLRSTPKRADEGSGPSAGAFATSDSAADTGAQAERTPSAALHALKQRLEHLLVPNGHAADEEREEEPGVPRPLRTAAAARARAGATVAARRSPAELWAARILAAALVAVLLIAFLLILTRIA